MASNPERRWHPSIGPDFTRADLDRMAGGNARDAIESYITRASSELDAELVTLLGRDEPPATEDRGPKPLLP